MAEFAKAYKKLEVAEGGYVNDPDDAGGETYKGVSRKANPNWIGWIILDDLKKHHPKNFLQLLLRKLHSLKMLFKTYIKRTIGTALILIILKVKKLQNSYSI